MQREFSSLTVAHEVTSFLLRSPSACACCNSQASEELKASEKEAISWSFSHTTCHSLLFS